MAVVLIGIVVLAVISINCAHRHCRVKEERCIVFECICGRTFVYDGIVGRTVRRRCACGKVDFRPRADICPDPGCGAHLAYLGERARDHRTFYRDKECQKSGRKFEFVMLHEKACTRLLDSLESRGAA